MTRPGILLVLDGWGQAPDAPGNAVAAARAPTLRALAERGGSTYLDASGPAVGLPAGVVGNSEIGHLVIGAGRALQYDSLLVGLAVDSGELRRHPDLRRTCERLVAAGAALHIVGLCSDGRIHSDVAHVGELLAAAADAGLTDVRLHAITDGRDVANGTAPAYLATLDGLAAAAGVGRCVSVVGRTIAMGKGSPRSVTKRAADLLVDGVGEASAEQPAGACEGQDDGAVPPTVIGSPSRIGPDDAVLFANFRSDRTAPLVDLVGELLDGTGRSGVELLSLAQYDTAREVAALVRRADAGGGLADVLERAGVRSVRIAEREKFDHVTFFLNGRDPRHRPYEDHVLVPTRAGDDYVEHPEMNVAGVAEEVCAAAQRGDVGLTVANLSNIDVVGHTGHYEGTVRATEAVDAAVATILAAARQHGRWVLLVGDHGNGEQMTQPAADGSTRPFGGHTHNLVPCVVIAPDDEGGYPLPEGASLPAVAPTVLALLGLDVPPAMDRALPVRLPALTAPANERRDP